MRIGMVWKTGAVILILLSIFCMQIPSLGESQFNVKEGIKNAIEEFGQSGIPGQVVIAAEVVGKLSETEKAGIISWIRAKMTDAENNKDWNKLERYNVVYSCISKGDCIKLKNWKQNSAQAGTSNVNDGSGERTSSGISFANGLSLQQCQKGYHLDDNGICTPNIKRPAKFLGSSQPLETFLVDDLHYTTGICADRIYAPVGSVILWGLNPDTIYHTSVITTEGLLQTAMGEYTITDGLDHSPQSASGKPYKFCQKIFYPPASSRSRISISAPIIVEEHKDDTRRPPGGGAHDYEWDCYGFAANLAYELLGGEKILNPP